MRYAIFDLDGTITDSMSYWRNAGQHFLTVNGYDYDEGLNHIENKNWLDGTCKYFREHYDFSVTPESLHKWIIDFVYDRYKTKVGFKPNAYELLTKLKNDGVKMCICSSTDKFLMQPALDRLDMNKFFEFTVHCREFGAEKNDPVIFKYCMEKLGAKEPSEVAVFEDALYSAKTAKMAGFYVVGMYDKTEPNKEQMQNTVDRYVYDYSELDFDKLPK